MRIRRAIERDDYYDDQPFDEQVWPVMVALGVSCALAVGAVATLLDGTWMWTMLLLLPALAAAAHFALAQMDDDSWLKRSLQLAALTSLSVHLAILIFTSAISIFVGPEPLPVQKVIQRRSRSIEITRRSNPFPWQKVVSPTDSRTRHQGQEKGYAANRCEAANAAHRRIYAHPSATVGASKSHTKIGPAFFRIHVGVETIDRQSYFSSQTGTT